LTPELDRRLAAAKTEAEARAVMDDMHDRLLYEAEKKANIKIVHVSSVGRFGRMWLSGTEAEIVTAKNAAIAALDALEGVSGH